MDLFNSLGIPSEPQEPLTKKELYKLKECNTDVYNKLMKDEEDNEVENAGSTITKEIEYVFTKVNKDGY